MLDRGYEVHLASDGDALAVLREQFPSLPYYELPSYRIRYGGKWTNTLKLLLKSPTAVRVMKRERRIIQRLQEEHGFTGLVSDNRPASFIPGIPSAYITHQLNVPAKLFTGLISRVHASYWRRFSEVWVPDFPDRRLSGKLSNPKYLDTVYRFVGPLSRLKRVETAQSIPWLAVLSGPEPARTQWENELRKVRSEMPEGGLIVLGKPGASNEDGIIGYASASELSALMNGAEILISRSGYSTVMDAYQLGKKALFVPTPGQGEQLYLAHQLKEIAGWEIGEQGKVNYRDVFTSLQREIEPDFYVEKEERLKGLFRLFEGEREGRSHAWRTSSVDRLLVWIDDMLHNSQA